MKRNTIGMGILLGILILSFSVIPVQAHIPEGWVPIEDCQKYCKGDGGSGDGGAESSAAVQDFSADVVYRATSDALDNLWEGEAPKRDRIKIVCNLPGPTAEEVIKVIVGHPTGDAPLEWTSEKPGSYEIVPPPGTNMKNLKPENFKLTFIDTRKNKEYVWDMQKEIPGIFPEGYFELRNKKAGGEELKWYEENQFTAMEGKIPGKITESAGKRISNEIHDNYAHPLDEGVVGKVDEEGTLLYLATKLAETGNKKDIGKMIKLSEEVNTLTEGFHHVAHEKLMVLAEESGKGQNLVMLLHDNLAHSMLASAFNVEGLIEEIKKTENETEVKEKAGELLEELKKFKKLTTEAHAHSTDPATAWTEQLPLKLKNDRDEIKIKHSDLMTYLSTIGGEKGEKKTEEKEPVPIGGAIGFSAIVLGLLGIGIWRYKIKK
ncbi:MAG: hypothetical protein U9M95_06670 [Candidatus Altiarchaeota archaeon]|nr:hypothetical protein [Candidatus Altiarchaeota archaeon]